MYDIIHKDRSLAQTLQSQVEIMDILWIGGGIIAAGIAFFFAVSAYARLRNSKAEKSKKEAQSTTQSSEGSTTTQKTTTTTSTESSAKKGGVNLLAVLGALTAVYLVLLAGKLLLGLVDSHAHDLAEEAVAAYKAANKASTDSTFYATFTEEWSEPITLKLDQCVRLQRQDSVAFELKYVDGSTAYIPKTIVPNETKIKIIDIHGRVVDVVKADRYGHIAMPSNRKSRQVRVVDAPKGRFEIRLTEE